MSNSQSGTTAGPTARHQGEASGKKTGLHQPSDDKRIQDKLENVDLASRGAKVHDHLRDKRSKGVAGAYDDSIDHDANERYVQDAAANRPRQ